MFRVTKIYFHSLFLSPSLSLSLSLSLCSVIHGRGTSHEPRRKLNPLIKNRIPNWLKPPMRCSERVERDCSEWKGRGGGSDGDAMGDDDGFFFVCRDNSNKKFEQ
ncbi:hypothetical protein RJT34_28110 [Clitoria ternatea]|uniref:Secreted protein n=1 Tax=Clitoria ternatea TaxID=43366 RepID=A0AAN9FH86_CLITE